VNSDTRTRLSVAFVRCCRPLNWAVSRHTGSHSERPVPLPMCWSPIPGGMPSFSVRSARSKWREPGANSSFGTQRWRCATPDFPWASARRRGTEVCPRTQQYELITRIRGFIDRNLGDCGLTPSLVASAHHISIRYLQRLFKTAGSTPSDWIRQRRLENSRRELCDARLRSVSVREIGLRNGFTQPSDFSRVFRAKYGVPPGRFRDDWFRRDAIGQSGGRVTAMTDPAVVRKIK